LASIYLELTKEFHPIQAIRAIIQCPCPYQAVMEPLIIDLIIFDLKALLLLEQALVLANLKVSVNAPIF
jgi:hypothetical protein